MRTSPPGSKAFCACPRAEADLAQVARGIQTVRLAVALDQRPRPGPRRSSARPRMPRPCATIRSSRSSGGRRRDVEPGDAGAAARSAGAAGGGGGAGTSSLPGGALPPAAPHPPERQRRSAASTASGQQRAAAPTRSPVRTLGGQRHAPRRNRDHVSARRVGPDRVRCRDARSGLRPAPVQDRRTPAQEGATHRCRAAPARRRGCCGCARPTSRRTTVRRASGSTSTRLAGSPTCERAALARPAGRCGPGAADIRSATPRPVEQPGRDHGLDHDRQRRLQAEHAEGRAAHSHSLSSIGCGAWSVATTSIVPSASASRSASTSARRPQRRVHLEDRVVGRRQLLGEQQVVRGHLGRDGDAARLGPARSRPSRRSTRGRRAAGSRRARRAGRRGR